MLELIMLIMIVQQPAPQRDAKPCTVTEVVTEGVRSDCNGWQPAKGEKMFMSAAISRQLKVGDVFYFAWQTTRWVAELGQPKIITCAVVRPDRSVACTEGNKQVLLTFTDQAEARELFDEWRLVAPMRGGRVDSDAPLKVVSVRRGEKVKATIVDGKFTPIPTCEVRVWRAVKAWRQGRLGEPPPNMLYTLPNDCQPWYGKETP